MNWTVALRILGLLLMMFSVTMLLPIVVSIYYNDHAWLPFVQGFALTLSCGVLCWLPVRNRRKELRLRDGFLVEARALGGRATILDASRSADDVAAEIQAVLERL